MVKYVKRPKVVRFKIWCRWNFWHRWKTPTLDDLFGEGSSAYQKAYAARRVSKKDREFADKLF